jgi:hypothetical protein
VADLGLSDGQTVLIQVPGTTFISTAVGCVPIAIAHQDQPATVRSVFYLVSRADPYANIYNSR